MDERDHSHARAALVTGSAGGLMRGVCVSLARSGFSVAAHHRPGGSDADETLSAVRTAGGTCFAFPADVTTAAGATSLVEAVRDRLRRIDTLVCGVGPMMIKDAIDTTPEEFDEMIAGNLTSAYLTIRAALPIMREQRFGRVICFGMTGSESTQGFRHLSAYVAAKAGLTAFVKTLALEEGPYGITCNVVNPGDIRDKDADRKTAAERRDYRNPTTRPGSWEDIGDAVAFLASDEASFINGAVLTVSGGWQGFFEKYSRWP
ncbi:MAG TPA: SDR family oxidoreductase [Candidatus Eremiobacteraceae bacterium]|nr:SDR family oxidoreductase [Candidatus Eremiobacteraceae bacterium]